MKTKSSIQELMLILRDNPNRARISNMLSELEKDNRCVGIVWTGSSAKIGRLCGDLDLLLFCSPHQELDNFFFKYSDMLRASVDDVLQVTPFLQQMGKLLSIYYTPDYRFSLDIGVIGEAWWPLIRLEPFAKILWKNDKFPKLRIGRDYSIERTAKAEFWISLWKISKAVQRAHYPRALEYLNRSRRALLTGYADNSKEFCYLDRPEQEKELFSNDILDELAEGFYSPTDISGICRSTESLVQKALLILSFNRSERKSIDVILGDLEKYK